MVIGSFVVYRKNMPNQLQPRRRFLKETSTAAALGLTLPWLPKANSAQIHPEAGSSRTILCVGAHPDDPESGCGGTLLLHQHLGDQVHVMYLTKGEAGIPGTSHQQAAQIREQEARNACKLLGATPHFAGQIDGATHFDREAVAHMREMIAAIKPDLVYTHWPLDSHPDHQVCSLLVYQSWLALDRAFPIWYFEVNSGYQTQQFQPELYVSIEAVAAQKKDVLYCHKSQDPDDIYYHHHLIMQQYRGRELGGGQAEAFIRLDSKALPIKASMP